MAHKPKSFIILWGEVLPIAVSAPWKRGKPLDKISIRRLFSISQMWLVRDGGDHAAAAKVGMQCFVHSGVGSSHRLGKVVAATIRVGWLQGRKCLRSIVRCAIWAKLVAKPKPKPSSLWTGATARSLVGHQISQQVVGCDRLPSGRVITEPGFL